MITREVEGDDWSKLSRDLESVQKKSNRQRPLIEAINSLAGLRVIKARPPRFEFADRFADLISLGLKDASYDLILTSLLSIEAQDSQTLRSLLVKLPVTIERGYRLAKVYESEPPASSQRDLLQLEIFVVQHPDSHIFATTVSLDRYIREIANIICAHASG
jgi:hypothetical protein